VLGFPQSNTGVLTFKSAHCRSKVGYIAGARVGLLRGTALLRRLHFSGTLCPCTHPPPPHPSPRGTKCLFGLQRHGTKCHTIVARAVEWWRHRWRRV